MGAPTRLLATTLFASGALLGCAPSSPSHTLYEWTDASGDIRYTPYPDRIPRAQRGSALPVFPEPDRGQSVHWATHATPEPTVEPAEPFVASVTTVETATLEIEPEVVEVEALAVETPPLLEVETAPLAVEVAPLAVEPSPTELETVLLESPSPPLEVEPAPIEVETEVEVEVETALPVPPPSPPTPESPLDARIQELELAIGLDQEALKRLLSEPASASGLQASEELREISQRLPQLQAELRSLREQRERAAGVGDGA